MPCLFKGSLPELSLDDIKGDIISVWVWFEKFNRKAMYHKWKS